MLRTSKCQSGGHRLGVNFDGKSVSGTVYSVSL